MAKKLTLEQMRGTCQSCKHWKSSDPTFGVCHRYPPTVVVGPSDSGEDVPMSISPVTEPTDRCGEFSPVS